MSLPVKLCEHLAQDCLQAVEGTKDPQTRELLLRQALEWMQDALAALKSGEAHAPELAHVATHESTLGAWTLSSRHRYQGHITGSKSAEPSALSVGHNVGRRDSPVRAALGLSKRPIAIVLRVVGLLVFESRASIARVATHLPPTRVRWRFWLASKASA